jgi:Restriction endonuclease AspBHI N-terminal/Restriction endonuclease
MAYQIFTSQLQQQVRKPSNWTEAFGKSPMLQPSTAIIVSSTPHKVGAASTPWLDVFDLDNGHVRYFGDNKTPGGDPALSRGNSALLNEFELHTSSELKLRTLAAPVVVLRRVIFEGKRKGYVEFVGVGVIERAERVTQLLPKQRLSFSNYVFDLALLSLAAESEVFDWRWILARRMQEQSAAQSLKLAPMAWKSWVKNGHASLARNRRRVSRLRVVASAEQIPSLRSKEASILKDICSWYAQRKHRFEALAAKVASRVLSSEGAKYTEGWLTVRGGDGGTDFIGRLDIGAGFGKTKLIVLGQAKCEGMQSPTGGNHIARTVARLKRGWLGVYVTTSYFSRAVQEEIFEDQYPIVLIAGLQVAQHVYAMFLKSGFQSLQQLLSGVDREYENQIANRRLEEILSF